MRGCIGRTNHCMTSNAPYWLCHVSTFPNLSKPSPMTIPVTNVLLYYIPYPVVSFAVDTV